MNNAYEVLSDPEKRQVSRHIRLSYFYPRFYAPSTHMRHCANPIISFISNTTLLAFGPHQLRLDPMLQTSHPTSSTLHSLEAVAAADNVPMTPSTIQSSALASPRSRLCLVARRLSITVLDQTNIINLSTDLRILSNCSIRCSVISMISTKEEDSGMAIATRSSTTMMKYSGLAGDAVASTGVQAWERLDHLGSEVR